VDAFVVASVIVMIDERLDLRLQVCWKKVVLQQDAVFQGLVPSLDLALCLINTSGRVRVFIIRCDEDLWGS